MHRTLKGSSQYDAQLSVVITNNLQVQVKSSYLETMPWLLQFELHTLRVHIDGVSRGTCMRGKRDVVSCLSTSMVSEAYSNSNRADDLVDIVSYTAPVPHSRPSMLQAVLTLPPKATLLLTMDVSKPFLRYTEHPPDAQRGWDLPPAVLVPVSFGNGSGGHRGSDASRKALPTRPTRIYTPVLLVDLATPDFSMPYNVIIMSCTLIALIFGSVFNLLTRKFVVVRVEGKSQ